VTQFFFSTNLYARAAKVPSFNEIGQTVEEIWRFNGFQNGGRPPSWITEIQIFYGLAG